MAKTSEIPEAAADAATAALYHDIRQVTGVGMVNLIYRQMATTPGLLPWAWGCVRPLFASGRIAEAVAVALAEPAPAAPIPEAAFAVVGVGPHALNTIAMIVDAYNTANSGNLFAIAALARFLADGGAARPPRAPEAPGPSHPVRALPPILAMDEMDASTAALVAEISTPISPPGRAMVPSLYRHLAPWPGLLALAAASVLSPSAARDAKAGAAALYARTEAVAAEMAADMAPPAGLPVPEASALAAIRDTAAAYAPGPIATMVVLGTALRRILPSETRA